MENETKMDDDFSLILHWASKDRAKEGITYITKGEGVPVFDRDGKKAILTLSLASLGPSMWVTDVKRLPKRFMIRYVNSVISHLIFLRTLLLIDLVNRARNKELLTRFMSQAREFAPLLILRKEELKKP